MTKKQPKRSGQLTEEPIATRSVQTPQSQRGNYKIFLPLKILREIKVGNESRASKSGMLTASMKPFFAGRNVLYLKSFNSRDDFRQLGTNHVDFTKFFCFLQQTVILSILTP